jgi:hypothetical protein
MKVNSEATKKDRLRNLLGSALALVGVVTVTIIGAMTGYHNVTVWVVGTLLIVIGILTAKSVALANFLNTILRF